MCPTGYNQDLNLRPQGYEPCTQPIAPQCHPKVLHTSLLFKLLQRQSTPIEPDVSSAFGMRHVGTIRNLTEVKAPLTVHELGTHDVRLHIVKIVKKVHQSAQLKGA